MITIAILNLKGGVGKTTTAVNLAAAFYHAGRRSLLVDLDTQGSASAHLGAPSDPDLSMGDVLMGDASIGGAAVSVLSAPIHNEGEEGKGDVLSLVPSGGVRLSMARTQLAARHSKNRLRKALEEGSGHYDVAVLDASPGLDALWLNALYAADLVVCPVELQMAAIVGLRGFLEVLSFAKEEDGLSVPVLYLPTNDDGRVAESRSLREVLVEQFGEHPGGQVLAPIRYSSALSKAVGARESIFEHAPGDRGAKDYAALALTLIHHLDV